MTKDERETLRQLLDAWTEGQVSEPLATRAAVALPELLAESERLEQVREYCEARHKAWTPIRKGSRMTEQGSLVREEMEAVMAILKGEGRD